MLANMCSAKPPSGMKVRSKFKHIYNLKSNGSVLAGFSWTESGSSTGFRCYMTIDEDVNATNSDVTTIYPKECNAKDKHSQFILNSTLFKGEYGIHDLKAYIQNKEGNSSQDVYVYYEQEPDGLQVAEENVFVSLHQNVNLTANLTAGTNIKAEWMVSVNDSDLLDFQNIVRNIYHVRNFSEVALHNVSLIVANEINSTVQFFNVCVQYSINNITLEPLDSKEGNTKQPFQVQLRIGPEAMLPMGEVNVWIHFDKDSPPVNKTILQGIQIQDIRKDSQKNTSILSQIEAEKRNTTEKFKHLYQKQGSYKVVANLQSQTDNVSMTLDVEIWDDLGSVELKPSKTVVTVNKTELKCDIMGHSKTGFKYSINYGDGHKDGVSDDSVYETFHDPELRHTYITSGTYKVEFRAYNERKEKWSNHTIHVYDAIPPLQLTADRQVVTTTDGNVEFSVKTDDAIIPNNVSCIFDFNDKSKLEKKSLLKNLTIMHNFHEEAVYNITLKCTNEVSTQTSSAQVKVLAFTVNDFNASTDTFWPMNASQPVTVTIRVTLEHYNNPKPPPGVSMAWDFGDNETENSSLENWNMEHEYSRRGSYDGEVVFRHNGKNVTRTFRVSLGVLSLTVDAYTGWVNRKQFNFTLHIYDNLDFQYKLIFDDGEEELNTSGSVLHVYRSPGLYKPYALAWNDTVSEVYRLSENIIVDNKVEGGLQLNHTKQTYFPPGNINLTVFVPRNKPALTNLKCKLSFGDEIDKQVFNFTANLSSTNPKVFDYTYKTLGIHKITLNCSNKLDNISLLSKINIINMCFSTDGIFDRQYAHPETAMMVFTHNRVRLRGRLANQCYQKGPEFGWEVNRIETDDSRTFIPISQSFSDYIRLEQGTLKAGLYEISLNISFTHLKNNWFVEKTYVRYKDPRLISSIDGGAIRVTTPKDLLIDAAVESYDPVVGMGHMTGLLFTWSCYSVESTSVKDLSSSTNTNQTVDCADITTPVKTGTILFRASTQPVKGFIFEVIVSKGSRRSYPARQLVQVVKDAPVIKLRCLLNCEMKKALRAEISVESICESCTAAQKKKAKYVWKFTHQAPGDKMFVQVPGSEAFFKDTGKNPASVVMKSNTLEPGTLYRLELEVTVEGMSEKGFASLDILTNIPPRGGVCSIDPEEGYALETQFVITCSGWKDEGYRMSESSDTDLDEPKEYTYALRKDDFYFPLHDHTGATSPKTKMMLAPDTTDENYNVEVKIVDVMKDYTLKSLPIKLHPPQVTNLLDAKNLNLNQEDSGGFGGLDSLGGLDFGSNILDGLGDMSIGGLGLDDSDGLADSLGGALGGLGDIGGGLGGVGGGGGGGPGGLNSGIGTGGGMSGNAGTGGIGGGNFGGLPNPSYGQSNNVNQMPFGNVGEGGNAGQQAGQGFGQMGMAGSNNAAGRYGQQGMTGMRGIGGVGTSGQMGMQGSTGGMAGNMNAGGMAGQMTGGISGQINAGGNVNAGGMAGQMNAGGMTGQVNAGGMARQINAGGMAGQINAGGMAGQMNSGGMAGQMSAGGTAGQANHGQMAGQTNAGGMTGQMNIGGIAGQMNTGGMAGQMNAGGIQRQTNTGGTVNKPNAGGMAGQMNNGGMAGQMNNGGMAGQMNNGGRAGQMNNGGMAGQMNNGGMSKQMNNGGMAGQMNNGGMAGQMNNGGRAVQMNAGGMAGQMNAGGMAGQTNAGGITGQINAGGRAGQMNTGGMSQANAGGMAGQINSGQMTGQLNAGRMTGHINAGGMAGQMNAGGRAGQMNNGGMAGQMNAGERAGQMNNGGMAEQMNAGGMTGQMNVGGRAGQINAGGMAGQVNAGGLAGQMNAGGMTGQMNTGGMAGPMHGDGMAGQRNPGGIVESMNGGGLAGQRNAGGMGGQRNAGGMTGQANAGGMAGQINAEQMNRGSGIAAQGNLAGMTGGFNVGGSSGKMGSAGMVGQMNSAGMAAQDNGLGRAGQFDSAAGMTGQRQAGGRNGMGVGQGAKRGQNLNSNMYNRGAAGGVYPTGNLQTPNVGDARGGQFAGSVPGGSGFQGRMFGNGPQSGGGSSAQMNADVRNAQGFGYNQGRMNNQGQNGQVIGNNQQRVLPNTQVNYQRSNVASMNQRRYGSQYNQMQGRRGYPNRNSRGGALGSSRMSPASLAAKRARAQRFRSKLQKLKKEDRAAVVVAALLHKGKKELEQSRSTGNLLKSVNVVSTIASVMNRIPLPDDDETLVDKTMDDGQSDNKWKELYKDYQKPAKSLAKKIIAKSSENMVDILNSSSSQIQSFNADQIASLSGGLALVLAKPNTASLDAAVSSMDMGLKAAMQLQNVTTMRPYPAQEEVEHGAKGLVKYIGKVLSKTTPDSSLRMPSEITEDTMSTPDDTSDTHYEENLFLMRKNAQANLLKKREKAEATRKILPKVEKSLDYISQSMETLVVPGQKPLVYKNNAISVSVQKKTPATLTDKINADEFEITLTAAKVAQNFIDALTEPTIQTVVFRDNPYVNSRDGSSDHITSSVLELTLKDNNQTLIDIPLKLRIRTPRPPKEGIYRMKDTMSGPSQMMYHRFLLRNSEDSTFIYIRVPFGVVNVTGYLRAGRAPTINKYDVRVVGNKEEWKGKEAYKILIPAHSLKNGTVYLAIKMTYKMGTILENTRKRRGIEDSILSIATSDADYIQFNTSEAVYAEIEDGEYGLVIVTDGCRVWDPVKEIWDAEACVISRFSTPEETFCTCEHTPGKSFATTFYVPPNTIDFSLVFTKFDPSNAAVYGLIIAIFGVYVLGLLWARRQDQRDVERWRVGYLMDNLTSDKYFYLLQVHTGLRKNSGTQSTISFVLAGENGDTGVRILSDGKRTFTTGSVMNYILAVPHQLADLSYLRIWHDNSGQGAKASWFLNKIIAEDLQSQQRYIFACDHWLAVDKEEGAIDRVLPVSVKDDFMTFDKLFSEHARLNITDTHLWLSIFVRPDRCNFSRVQRVSCCLALLFLMMISSAMFYKSQAEKDEEQTIRHEVKIGALRFSMTSFYVSLVSLMVTMPPTILLVMLFKSSKPNPGKKAIAKPDQPFNAETDVLANRLRNKPLPHFCVYVAWTLLALIIATCGFFLILYSMQWGREVSEEWLTSFFMCFAQSVVVMDPLKVVILAILLAFCLRDPFEARGEIDIARVESEARMFGKDELDLLCLPPEPLPESVLAKARRRRRKEVRAQSVFLELIQYIIFLFAIYSLSFGNRDDRSFMIHEHIENNLFTSSINVEYPFESIRSYEDFFIWAKGTLIPRLFPETDLRGSRLPWRKRLFFSDLTNFRVGPARIRQLRMPRHQSPFYGKQYNSLVSNENYYGSYSLFSEDANNYCLKWRKRPCPKFEESAFLTSTAWRYTSSSDVWGLPVAGQYKIYSGGGYMLELNVNYDVSRDMLDELYQHSWLDRRTRAVFVEFTLYNAFVNIMAYVRLAAEFPETGSTIIWHDIMTFRLDQHHGSLGAYVLLCEIVISIILIIFTINLMKKLWEQRMSYFLHIWQTLDLLTVIWCMVAVVFYVIRELNAAETLSRFRDNPKKFVNFQHIAVWDSLFVYALGALVFSTTIRILRILGYNKRVTIIAAVLSNSAKDLTGFGIVFGIVFFAYVLSGYILFSAHYYGYHTIYDSMFTIFTYMLGKNIMARLMLIAPIWAQIYFSTLVFFIIFVLLTMFQAIMNNSMTVVRDNIKKVPPPYGLVNVVLNIYRALIRDWLPDSFFKNQQKKVVVVDEHKRDMTYMNTLKNQLDLAVTAKKAFKRPSAKDYGVVTESLGAKILQAQAAKKLQEKIERTDDMKSSPEQDKKTKTDDLTTVVTKVHTACKVKEMTSSKQKAVRETSGERAARSGGAESGKERVRKERKREQTGRGESSLVEKTEEVSSNRSQKRKQRIDQ